MKIIKILIVDDDEDHADGLADFIELHGCLPTVAYTGEEAVRKFASGRFDLVFLDFKLPGMNGVEVLRAIRGIDPEVKAIMMTGFMVQDLNQQIGETDILEVLQKPLSLEVLMELVNNCRPEKTVLVADDDSDFTESIGSLLEGHGYRILSAGTAAEILKIATANPVDLLLLDLRLDGDHGLHVYEELVARGLKIPTIIVTGFAKEEIEAVAKLHAYSVDRLLSKPFAPEALLLAMEEVWA